MAGLVAALLWIGPAGIFPGDFPPVEELTVTKATLRPGEIVVDVANGGPDVVTIAQVLVDEAYWNYTITPSPIVQRLRSAQLAIAYPWVEGEPVHIKIISSTGVTFEHQIEVAVTTPPLDGRFFLTFALLGIYIGVLPVAFGMTARPFIAALSRRWIHFFMAMAAGVLIFLLVETGSEALDASALLPAAMGGIGVVGAAGIGSFALILAGARWLQDRTGVDRRLVVAYSVAAGIGLHNLGEGLAVGSAYRLGEIALGVFLVMGFAIHNVTEGIGIVSVLGKRRTAMTHLAALSLIAGAPTILGTWTGAYLFSPLLATVFLGVAAGAIAEVVFDVLKAVRDEAVKGLATIETLGGITAGLAVMYLTGLFVAA